MTKSLLEVYREKPVKYGIVVLIVLRTVVTVSTVIGVEFYRLREMNSLYYTLGPLLFHIVTSIIFVLGIIALIPLKKINDYYARRGHDAKIHYYFLEGAVICIFIDAFNDIIQLLCACRVLDGKIAEVVYSITEPHIVLGILLVVAGIHIVYFKYIKKRKIFLLKLSLSLKFSIPRVYRKSSQSPYISLQNIIYDERNN